MTDEFYEAKTSINRPRDDLTSSFKRTIKGLRPETWSGYPLYLYEDKDTEKVVTAYVTVMDELKVEIAQRGVFGIKILQLDRKNSKELLKYMSEGKIPKVLMERLYQEGGWRDDQGGA